MVDNTDFMTAIHNAAKCMKLGVAYGNHGIAYAVGTQPELSMDVKCLAIFK